MHWFKTWVAPLVAAAVMAFAVYLLVKYRTVLAGGVKPPIIEWAWLPPLLVFVLGIVLAQLYKARDRARYEGIGRYLHEDIGT